MILFTVGCVLTGLIGSLRYPALSVAGQAAMHYGFVNLSNLLFLLLVWDVHRVFTMARTHLRGLVAPQVTGDRGERQKRIRDHTLRSLYAQEGFFLLAWTLIPVAFFVTVYKVVDVFTSELLFTIGDLLAKVIFANVALSSNYLAGEDPGPCAVCSVQLHLTKHCALPK